MSKNDPLVSSSTNRNSIDYKVREFGIDWSQFIGQGKFGKVYKSYSKKLSKIIALKHIVIKNAKLLSNVERQIFTMTMASRQSSECVNNIVKIYGHETTQDEVFIFMEYCQGGDIKKRTGNITEVQLMNLVEQLLNALEVLHSKNIIHRDIKPQNLFLDQNNHLKIGDFGLARICDIIMTGRACTPIYGAPEVLQLKPYDQKCDVWSVGLVIYELITGQHLFKNANSFTDLSRQMTNLKQKKLQIKYNKFNSQWVFLTKMMLSHDPRQRPSIKQVKTYFKILCKAYFEGQDQKQQMKIKSLQITKQLLPSIRITAFSQNHQYSYQPIELSKVNLRKARKYLDFELQRTQIFKRLTIIINQKKQLSIQNIIKYIILAFNYCLCISKRRQVVQEISQKILKPCNTLIGQKSFTLADFTSFQQLLKIKKQIYQDNINQWNSILKKQICKKLFEDYPTENKYPQLREKFKDYLKLLSKVQQDQFARYKIYQKTYRKFINEENVYKKQDIINSYSQSNIIAYGWIRLLGHLNVIITNDKYQIEDYVYNQYEKLKKMKASEMEQYIKPYNIKT